MAGAFIGVLLQSCVSRDPTFWDERGPLPPSVVPEVKGPRDLDELKAQKEAQARKSVSEREAVVGEEKPGFWARLFGPGGKEAAELPPPIAEQGTPLAAKHAAPIESPSVKKPKDWPAWFGEESELSTSEQVTEEHVEPQEMEKRPGFWARLFGRESAEPAVEPEMAVSAPEVPAVIEQEDISLPESPGETTEASPGFWARLFGRSATGKEEPVEVPGELAIVEKQLIPEKPRKPDVQNVVQTTAGQMATVTNEPVLKPGLIVKIVVLASGRKEVDEPGKRVSPSGSLTLPLVGTMQVEGLNIREFAEKLQVLYAKYLREPMVDVDFVLEDQATTVSPWGYVTVLGRVKRPGRVNVPPTSDLTLSMAIQLAGGLDSSAKLTGIKITRENNGKSEQFSVDLQSVGDKGATESDVPLLPGDFVYVPERVF